MEFGVILESENSLSAGFVLVWYFSSVLLAFSTCFFSSYFYSGSELFYHI